MFRIISLSISTILICISATVLAAKYTERQKLEFRLYTKFMCSLAYNELGEKELAGRQIKSAVRIIDMLKLSTKDADLLQQYATARFYQRGEGKVLSKEQTIKRAHKISGLYCHSTTI